MGLLSRSKDYLIILLFLVCLFLIVFSPLTPPTSSLLDEILLHVVTVDLGAAEDDGLVHLVLFDGPHCVLALQDLNGFRPHL